MENLLFFQGNCLPREVNYSYCKNSFKLPKYFIFQIILNIYKYLPLQDILKASATCKQWHLSSLHCSVSKKRHLIIKEDLLGESRTKYLKLLDSIICYSKLGIIDSPSCTNNIDFWSKLGNSIEYLDFDFCEFLQKTYDILKHLPNLKSLHLNFREVIVMESRPNIPEPQLELTKLKTFVFHMDKYSSTHSLKYLLLMMPELDHINLKLDQKLNKKVRDYLFNYLNEGKNRIKNLIMYADKTTWKSVWTIKGMKLNTLSINIIDEHKAVSSYPLENAIYNCIDKTFTDNYKLLHLKVPDEHHQIIIDMAFFANTFPNLQTFNFQNNGTENITELKNFTKLKSLFIQNLNLELAELLGEKLNLLENLSISRSAVFQTSDVFYKHAVNLTYLNLEECGIQTDEMLQEMFKNLTHLKHLKITQHKCCKITDYGFTGEFESKNTGYTISNLKNLESLYIRINLSQLSDLTLSHISKLQQLKTLNIYCKNVILWSSHFKFKNSNNFCFNFSG